MHDLLDAVPLDVESARLHVDATVEEPILGADLVAPERIAGVGVRRAVWVTERLHRRVAGRSVVERRIDSADAIALGGTRVEQSVLIDLNVDAVLRVDDGLALGAGELGRSRAVERPVDIDAVVVGLARHACAGYQTHVLEQLPGGLAVGGKLPVAQGLLLIDREAAGEKRLTENLLD